MSREQMMNVRTYAQQPFDKLRVTNNRLRVTATRRHQQHNMKKDEQRTNRCSE
jgi:hypothetical protein